MFLVILFLHVVFYAEADIQSQISNRIPKSYSPKIFKSCFEHLGCIDTTEAWYDKEIRPVNLEPLDRHTIKTQFVLIKSTENELSYDIMASKNTSIEVAGFVKDSPTMFLIHDFTSHGYTGWVKHMTRVASTAFPNIISVDWEGGAEPPFLQAIANARVVALEIEIFCLVLKNNFGVDPTKIHIVGHGVGAHIAGYVGRSIKDLDRITALDPTGPYFAGMPEEVRLDSKHAKFVEVLHTDAFNFRSQGTKDGMGHVDFYINNAALQPGCNYSNSYPEFTKIGRDSIKEGQILPACSHKRSFKYFIESIESKDCQFLGIKCDSYETFSSGKCHSCNSNKSSCAVMGLNTVQSNSNEGKFYFNTRGEFPFCMHPYVVNISISEESSKQTGTFEIIFVDENNEVANATNAQDKMIKYERGKTYTSIFYASPPKVSTLKEAKVKWIHKRNPFCILFCNQDIHVKEISVKFLSSSETNSVVSKLCPVTKNRKIPNGDYLQFLRCDVLSSTSPTESAIQSTTKEYAPL